MSGFRFRAPEGKSEGKAGARCRRGHKRSAAVPRRHPTRATPKWRPEPGQPRDADSISVGAWCSPAQRKWAQRQAKCGGVGELDHSLQNGRKWEDSSLLAAVIELTRRVDSPTD